MGLCNGHAVPSYTRRASSDQATYAVAVLLHDRGQTAVDLTELADVTRKACPSVEVLVPNGSLPCIDAAGFEWFRTTHANAWNPGCVRHAAAEISVWLDEELSARRLPRDRALVAGVGQGGALALWLALNRQPPLQGAAAFDARVVDCDAEKTIGTAPIVLAYSSGSPLVALGLAADTVSALERRGARIDAVETGVAQGVGFARTIAVARFATWVNRLRCEHRTP